MIKTATGLAAKDNLYTAATIKSLKTALDAAEKVYKNEDATQDEVKEQVSALSKSISALEQKSSSSNNNNSGNNSSSDSNNSSLDVNNLADGVYSVTGKMLKTDKTSVSMSDDAINKTIKLTVKNGKYTITLNFKGLTINNQLGYLGKLKYFKTGYTLDKYGSPKGSVGNVTVESYQKYDNGKKVSDSFGSNYPDVVSFPMITEAKKDGYVPLQVFVPIMDSISKGSGTQPVFLHLDWSTLKKTTKNDPDFKDTSSNTQSGTGTTGTGTRTSGSNTSNLNTMSTNSKLGGSNSSLKTNSSISKSSSLKSTGTTSLKSDKKSLTSDKGNKKDSKTLLESASAVSFKDSSVTGTGDVTADKSESTNSSESEKDISKVMVPSVISTLAALAGILYKLKSRMGL